MQLKYLPKFTIMKKLLFALAFLLPATFLFAQPTAPTTINRAMSVWARRIVNANATQAYTDATTNYNSDALKAPIASPTFTGTVTIPTPFTLGAVSVLPTGTELNFVDGVTSAIQTQMDLKSPLATPTFSGIATFGGAVSLGGWGYTGEHTVVGETSSNTNANFGNYSMVNYDGASGKVYAGAYNRLLNMTTNQTNNTSHFGSENQYRLRDVDISTGVHAGAWLYAEQSGTSTLSGGAIFTGTSITIESAATFTVGATEKVVGAVIDGSINAGASINGSANFSGLWIKSAGKDFFDGIYITGATNDIKLQNDETIDNATDGIVVVTGNLEVNGTGGANFGADGQGNDDYEISLPGVDALVAGLTVIFTATTANTDGSTLEITEIGDLDAILKLNDQATATNDIEAGSVVMVVFDGSNWQMISPAAN